MHKIEKWTRFEGPYYLIGKKIKWYKLSKKLEFIEVMSILSFIVSILAVVK